MKLRVAEVGMGGISGAHVPAWTRMEDVELVAICDIRPEMMDRYDGQTTARSCKNAPAIFCEKSPFCVNSRQKRGVDR